MPYKGIGTQAQIWGCQSREVVNDNQPTYLHKFENIYDNDGTIRTN
jgi:hypothetical protein